MHKHNCNNRQCRGPIGQPGFCKACASIRADTLAKVKEIYSQKGGDHVANRGHCHHQFALPFSS